MSDAYEKPSHVAALAPDEPNTVTVSKTKHDPSRIQKAARWKGKQHVLLQPTPRPLITDPGDAILQVTSTGICGSDLHLYNDAMVGMRPGDVLGHEFMGVVEDVGPDVTAFKKGDRAVAAFVIACGKCFYCKQQLYSACETTNPTGGYQEELYGHHTAGFYGYTHLSGGFDGGQAQLVRVPHADHDLLKVPDEMSDEQVVFLSDILPTAWHACELAGVKQHDNVAIWGAGPVGTLAALCAKHRGAARVVVIDDVDYRLENAFNKIPGIEIINFRETPDVPKALKELIPVGPDCGIEAVGLHYAKSQLHQAEIALKLETDSADMLNEIIKSVRKGGRIGLVGVYAGFCNHFNIGGLMEKGLTVAAGQTPVQKYWHMLLEKVRSKELDPTIVLTHQLPLTEVSRAYEMFNDKKDGCIKVILKPAAAPA